MSLIVTNHDNKIRNVSRMLIDQTGKQHVYKHECYRHRSASNMCLIYPAGVNLAGLLADNVIHDDAANVLSRIMRRLETLS